MLTSILDVFPLFLILGLACIYRLVTSLLLIVLAMHLTPTGLQFSSKLVNLILQTGNLTICLCL
ncbi:Uncharacterised protein [Segatella copri]|nr:Uncharacterised protein [Segatella copri]